MDSYDALALTTRPSASSGLEDFFVGITPLQKQLESVRKQISFVCIPAHRKKCSFVHSCQKKLILKKFTFLLHKQWMLYSLTPLYKFFYTYIKGYSKLLSAFIAAGKQKRLAVKVGLAVEDFNIKVIFSTLLGIKGTQKDLKHFLSKFYQNLSGHLRTEKVKCCRMVGSPVYLETVFWRLFQKISTVHPYYLQVEQRLIQP